MSKKENKNFIKEKLINNLPLIIVLIFSLSITISLIYINGSSNILGHSYRDVYLYLIQSLRFTGVPIEGYEFVNYLSPLIPFLTSILFRLGFISEWSLFTITGVFSIIGTIGVYYLLKLRFNKNISCFGAILYGSLTINLLWTGNGTLDIPSIAFSIWSLYYFILAIEKKQRYFYIAFPLAILSFLAKYTGGLIFAIIILYFLSKRNIFGNIKRYFLNGIGGIIAGIICLIPFFYYYYINNLPLGFLNQAEEISSTTTTSATAIAKHTGNQLFYYFQNIPRFVYAPREILGYSIVIIAIIGLIYGIYKFSEYISNYYKNCENKISISFIENIKLRKEIHFIILILSLSLMILAFLTASTISFIESEVIFFVAALIFSISFNSIFKDIARLNLFDSTKKDPNKYKYFNYDLTILAWFMGYMIFFSAHLTKADRYFTAFAPSFVFFISYSLDRIISLVSGDKLLTIKSNKKENSNKNRNNKNNIQTNTKMNKENLRIKIAKMIPVIIILVLIISTIGYLTINKHDTLVDNEKDASLWIEENVPNYTKLTIWADRGPIYTWYLRTNIEYKKDTVDSNELGNYLNERNASYYIATPWNNTIDGFTKVKTFGEVNIYKNNNL